jgi:Tripartite tricarboxylate transporter family receptor
MANRMQFTMLPLGLVVQHINSGAMKALAVLGTIRSPLLPNVPTMSEAGYPEVNVVPWFGYGAPRGTPRPVIDKIVAGFNEVMKVPTIRAALQKQALQPMGFIEAGPEGSSRVPAGGAHQCTSRKLAQSITINMVVMATAIETLNRALRMGAPPLAGNCRSNPGAQAIQ